MYSTQQHLYVLHSTLTLLQVPGPRARSIDLPTYVHTYLGTYSPPDIIPEEP